MSEIKRVRLCDVIEKLSRLPEDFKNLEVDMIDVSDAQSIDEIGICVNRTGDGSPFYPIKNRVCVIDG